MFTIRGKRTKAPTRDHANRTKSAKRGRPMKHDLELSQSREVKRQAWQRQHRIYHTTFSPSTVSQLEALPNELIQQIFFACFEVNLPRASLRLAQALSTDSTYQALILFAFFDDDMNSPVERERFLPAKYRSLAVWEKIDLQQKILSCRWLTVGRIKACLPALAGLRMTQSWYVEKHHIDMHQGKDVVDPQGENASSSVETGLAEKSFQELAQLPALDDYDGLIKHFFAKSVITEKYPEQSGVGVSERRTETEEFLPRIITWRMIPKAHELPAEAPTSALFKRTAGPVSTLGARVLPDWLVGGTPWTQDNLELLQLLRHGFQYIHDREQISLDVSITALFKGMAGAIRERHLVALLTLLELYNTCLETASDASETKSGRLPDQYLLPIHLFHNAAKAGSKSSALMWLLIRGCSDAIPVNDHGLTAWALRGQATGDQVADFLLNYMSGTAHDCNERMFTHGRLCSCFDESELPPADSTFGEELKYFV